MGGAKERIWNDDMGFSLPSDKIECMECKWRAMKGLPFGGKLAMCEKYARKPDGILFDGVSCPVYEKDG